MKNFLTEKMLLDAKHGSDCTLEVCTAGEPDNDKVIMKGSCGDCLRKIATHELAFTGDEYFCLYTEQGSYDGIDLDTICYRMGYSPDSIYEMLSLNDSADLSDSNESPELVILSMEDCLDEDYGSTIVQYKIGDLISFAFSNVPVKDALAEPEKVIADIQECRSYLTGQPLWSALSQNLLDVILEEPFDMFFVEYNDPEWTEEMSEVLWDEVGSMGLEGFVRCGEDGALVTVYAGAMNAVDWTGHPQYGEPCLQHTFENNVPVTDKKPGLGDLIQKAESAAAHQFVSHVQERNGDSHEH